MDCSKCKLAIENCFHFCPHCGEEQFATKFEDEFNFQSAPKFNPVDENRKTVILISVPLILLFVFYLVAKSFHPISGDGTSNATVAAAASEAAALASEAAAAAEAATGETVLGPRPANTSVNEPGKNSSNAPRVLSDQVESAAKNVYVQRCLSSLTEGSDSAVMSISPEQREAMCQSMYEGEKGR